VIGSPKKGSVRIKHLLDFAGFGGNLPLRHSAFDIPYPKRYDRAVKIESTASYTNWINDLRDLQARARIQARVERLASGNPGRHRVLTGDVSELKIDYGPGYRVYYTQRGDVLIILLCGGDKRTQKADIETARKLAEGL
jgi:putative addiction module killer protein